MGWTLACPFCRDPQKRESKSNEKCASLYPVEGTFLIFSLVKGDWMVGFREFSPVIIRCGSPPSSSSGTHLNTGSMWERRKKRRRTINPSSLVRDRKGLQDLRLHQQSCIACLIELLWSCSPWGRWKVMNCLILLPSAELISYLDFVFGCCHDWWCDK